MVWKIGEKHFNFAATNKTEILPAEFQRSEAQAIEHLQFQGREDHFAVVSNLPVKLAKLRQTFV